MTSVMDSKTVERVTVKLTMTVDDARQVPWVGTRDIPKEPMGKLLDEKRLTQGNLAWAVENAYSNRVRAAARTLLVQWLGEPQTILTTTRHGPEVHQGSTYLEEQERKHEEEGDSSIMTIVAFLFILPLMAALQDITGVRLTLLNTAVILVLFIPAFWWLLRDGKKHFREAKSYRAGRLGEDKVVDRMLAVLDGEWTIYRNMQVPGQRSDIDVVLVGSGGVWTVEVKEYGVPVRVVDEVWERQSKKAWYRLTPAPTTQARGNAVELSKFLKSSDITCWVEPAAVLIGSEDVQGLQASKDAPQVWLARDLDPRLDELKTRLGLTAEQASRVKQALDGLLETQRIEGATKKPKRSLRLPTRRK